LGGGNYISASSFQVSKRCGLIDLYKYVTYVTVIFFVT
jgi:hypothetical protein